MTIWAETGHFQQLCNKLPDPLFLVIIYVYNINIIYVYNFKKKI